MEEFWSITIHAAEELWRKFREDHKDSTLGQMKNEIKSWDFERVKKMLLAARAIRIQADMVASVFEDEMGDRGFGLSEGKISNL